MRRFQLYEDVEFGLLEEEAGWLARREELHRDRAAAVAARRARRARAEWLRAQLDQLRSVGEDQLRALRHDINAATLSIQQVGSTGSFPFVRKTKRLRSDFSNESS